MMQQPWDRAQPDEWLLRSLRLCWGDGDGGGGGFGGDGGGGGWGDGGYGGATTGGGDWGSSGSYDASGYNAGGDVAAYAGTAYDASTAGTGAGGGGDWGSYGPTSYSGMNAPNPIFTDVTGPNPGVTTGGGDWGSAGTFSAAGTGGGPGGTMGFGGTSGGGTYGTSGGGGLFGDYGGGGGGGYGGGYGGGGGGGGGKGGAFGSFGTLGASNAVSSVNGPDFADTAGSAGGHAASPVGGHATDPAGGESESDAPSQSEGVDPGGEQYGVDVSAPTSDAAPAPEADAGPDTSPSLSDGAPAGNIGGKDDAAPASQQSAAAPEGSEVGAAAGGPGQGVGSDYVASSEGRDAAPSWDTGSQPTDSFDSRFGDWGTQQAPSADSFDSRFGDWGQTQAATTDDSSSEFGPFSGPDVVGDRGSRDNADPLGGGNISVGPGPGLGTNTGILGMNTGTLTQATGTGSGPGFPATGLLADLGFDQITSSPDLLGGIDWSSVFEAPTQEPAWGEVFAGAAPAYDPLGEPFSTPTSTDTTYTPGGDPALSGHPDDPSARSDVFEGAPSNQNVDWGEVFQGATPPPTEPDWASVFEGAPSNQNVDWASVFEGAAPAPAPTTPPIPIDTITVSPDVLPEGLTPAEYNKAVDEFARLDAEAAAKNAQDAAAFDTADKANQDRGAPAPDTTPSEQQPSDGLPGLPGVPGLTSSIPGGRPTDFNYPTQTPPSQTPGQVDTAQPSTTSTIPGGRPTDFNYGPPTSTPAPSLIDMAQPAVSGGNVGGSIPAGRMTDFNYPTSSTLPTGQPGGIGSDIVASPEADDDAPEPEGDRSQPPQDPNVPRPPGNVPGQLQGSRGQYDNPHADTPQTSRTYRDPPGTAYTQGRPGITFRTARQAGIQPLFRTEDINTGDTDAQLIANINRALQAMQQRTGIDPRSLVATSGWRAARREEALEHGMDPRTSQASVRSRSNPIRGRSFPAAEPGHSNHGPGRALDFAASPARAWLRANAREFGLETLGGTFDMPHIQLQRGQGGQRPSAQEQAEQQALDAQTRQAAIDRGLIAPGRGDQAAGRANQAAVPMPRGRPADAPPAEIAAPQPDVARPPADIPPAPPAATRPPPEAPLPDARPPADIPSLVPPRVTGPNEYDIPVTPAVRNATTIANNILKQATAHLNKDSSAAALNAAGVVAAKAMAAAGIPANLARSLMLKGALDGAIANGYGPGGPNSTIAGFSIWGKVQSTIAESVNSAMQGYHPSKPGELFGPPAPTSLVPGKRSEAPFGQQFADLSQSLGPTPTGDYARSVNPKGREGDVGAQQSIFSIPGLQYLSPLIEPPAPSAPRSDGRQYADLRGLVQGPYGFQPAASAPGKRSEAPFGSFVIPVAGGRDAGNAPAVDLGEPGGGSRGRAEWESSRPGPRMGTDPNVVIEGPEFSPPAPPSAFQAPALQGRGVLDPDIFPFQQQERDLQQQLFDPRGWQQASRGNVILVAGGRDVGAPPAVDPDEEADLPAMQPDIGRAEWETTLPGGIFPGLDLLEDVDPRSGAASRDVFDPDKAVPGRVFDPDEFSRQQQEQQQYQQDFDPRGWQQASLSDFLQSGLIRGLAKGGHVDEDEPVVVGEEGPEYFVPDRPGTVVPHMPQPGKGGKIDRWPKIPAPEYPGRFGGVEREILRQTRDAQDPAPSLMDMIDSGRLRLDAANWNRMLDDPYLIALGRSRMDDRREGIDPGAEQYGVFPPPPAAEPPDPASPMAQALGYDSIVRRPMRIGRQSYQNRR